MKFFTSLLLALSLSGCQSPSTIVPFHAIAEAPTNPVGVGIYRKSTPFKAFDEIGLITFRTSIYDLPSIYQKLREDSAAQGAEAVIDTKIKGESHTEWESEKKCTQRTECDSNNVCNTVDDCHDEQVAKTVTTYLVEGSMIRRKK